MGEFYGIENNNAKMEYKKDSDNVNNSKCVTIFCWIFSFNWTKGILEKRIEFGFTIFFILASIILISSSVTIFGLYIASRYKDNNLEESIRNLERLY